MSRNIPEASEAEPRMEDTADLFAQALELTERVEKMTDGPRKEKLRIALAKIRTDVGEFTSKSA